MREEILQFSYEKLLSSVDAERLIRQLKLDVDILDVRRFFAGCEPVHGIMAYSGREDAGFDRLKIQGNQFIFSDTVVNCDLFQEYSSCQIKSAMAYLISCNPVSNAQGAKGEAGQMNYHFIQNLCLELVRVMNMQNFKRLTVKDYGAESTLHFSEGFGPGYYGMPMGEGKRLFELLGGNRIGVSYHGEMMEPVLSSIGMVFSYTGPARTGINPCMYCEANQRNCDFCLGVNINKNA